MHFSLVITLGHKNSSLRFKKIKKQAYFRFQIKATTHIFKTIYLIFIKINPSSTNLLLHLLPLYQLSHKNSGHGRIK